RPAREPRGIRTLAGNATRASLVVTRGALLGAQGCAGDCPLAPGRRIRPPTGTRRRLRESTHDYLAAPPVTAGAAQRALCRSFARPGRPDRKSTRLHCTHEWMSYAVIS